MTFVTETFSGFVEFVVGTRVPPLNSHWNYEFSVTFDRIAPTIVSSSGERTLHAAPGSTVRVTGISEQLLPLAAFGATTPATYRTPTSGGEQPAGTSFTSTNVQPGYFFALSRSFNYFDDPDPQGTPSRSLGVLVQFGSGTSTFSDVEVQASISGSTGNQGEYGVGARVSINADNGQAYGYFLTYSLPTGTPTREGTTREGTYSCYRLAYVGALPLANLSHRPGAVVLLKVSGPMDNVHVVASVDGQVIYDGYDTTGDIQPDGSHQYHGMYAEAVPYLDNSSPELFFQNKIDDFSLKKGGILFCSDDFNRPGSSTALVGGSPVFVQGDKLGSSSVGAKAWVYLTPPASEAHGWQIYDGAAMAYLGLNVAAIDVAGEVAARVRLIGGPYQPPIAAKGGPGAGDLLFKPGGLM